MNIDVIVVTLSVLTIVFNAGGVIWLAKNHMAHAQRELEKLSDRLGNVEEDVAFIKGRINGSAQIVHPQQT